MKNLINRIFYGKYNNTTYNKYKSYIYKNNLKSLVVLCSINLIVGIMLFVILFFINAIKTDFIYYLFTNIFVSAVGIVILKRNFKINPIVLSISFYIYMLVTISVYKMIAVNYDIIALIPLVGVMYVVNSFLFIDKPFRYNLIMGVFMLWLCSVIKIDEFIIMNYFVYAVIYVIGVIVSYFKFENILEGSKTLNQVQKERDLDMLTKLHNRGAAERVITESLISDPYGSALIIFDLDNFKYVNDTYGHSEGDEFLIKVANIMKSIFRKGDFLSRLGGDEFIIFINENADKDFIKNRAEKLIKEIKNIKYKGKSLVGCSIGVVLATRNDDFNSLYKKADVALYESKNSGKGRYTFYKET